MSLNSNHTKPASFNIGEETEEAQNSFEEVKNLEALGICTLLNLQTLGKWEVFASKKSPTPWGGPGGVCGALTAGGTHKSQLHEALRVWWVPKKPQPSERCAAPGSCAGAAMQRFWGCLKILIIPRNPTR